MHASTGESLCEQVWKHEFFDGKVIDVQKSRNFKHFPNCYIFVKMMKDC